MNTVTSVPAATLDAIAVVGKIVTHGNHQYRVHSVEGHTWFAYDDNGTIRMDLDLPASRWITEPLVGIIPMGSKIAAHAAEMVPLHQVRRGVCLVKPHI